MEGLEDSRVEATTDDILGGEGTADAINGKEEVVMVIINEVEALAEIEVKEDEEDDTGGKHNLATMVEVNITSTSVGASTSSIVTIVAFSLPSTT